MLKYQILTHPSDVEAIENEWRVLHARLKGGPFTDWDWFATWWQTIGDKPFRRLYIVTGREEGRLVALLPLTVVQKGAWRVLQPIGTEIYHQCDILCEAPDLADKLWKFVREARDYDFANLPYTNPESECDRVLSVLAKSYEKTGAPYVGIVWKKSEDWKATLPHKVITDLARRMRRLQEKGKVEYHLSLSGPVPEKVIEAMVAQKIRWGTENNFKGMFEEPNILAYVRELARKGSENNTLFLKWLTCDDTIIACQLKFRYYDHTLYSYVVTYDQDWYPYSPGNLMTLDTISWAIDNGFKEFDFLHGDYPYKHMFGNRKRFCKEFVFSRTLWGKAGIAVLLCRRHVKEYLAALKKKLK